MPLPTYTKVQLLQLAEEQILKGDYGGALFYAKAFREVSISLDGKAEQNAENLTTLVYGLIGVDLRESVARQLGTEPEKVDMLKILIPERLEVLLNEHSRHYIRYKELVRNQPAIQVEVPLNSEPEEYSPPTIPKNKTSNILDKIKGQPQLPIDYIAPTDRQGKPTTRPFSGEYKLKRLLEYLVSNNSPFTIDFPRIKNTYQKPIL